MAEFLARRALSARRVFSRRVVVVAAVVVVAGAVAGGVALAASGSRGSGGSEPGSGAVATAPVVRTTLTSTTQVGGSIGYAGSYTITAPSGTSASQVAQAQQALAQDQQTLSADQQAESDAAAAGNQKITADKANVAIGRSTLSADQSTLSADQSTLTADQAKKTKDCAGAGASSSACAQDTQQVSQDTQQVAQDKQKVAQDQAALTQARQQLAADQSAAKTSGDQNQAKVQSDQTRLKGDQAALASDLASAVNPGTTYTWLPKQGKVIRQDQPVYKVSNQPVPLLYGAIPAYRAFYVGMPGGGDVGELTHDLIALGYGAGLTQSNHYSSATTAAVRRWQTALGLPTTGQILLGEVVFEPGPIRVTSVTPSVGSPAGGGGGGAVGAGGGGVVLTATGTTPIVTVSLPVDQEYLVKSGDSVSVVLPDGTSTMGGKVETVGTVATCPGGGGIGSGTGNGTGSGTGAGQSPCSSAGSGGSAGSNSSATVTVTITLDHTPPGAALDQAPVNVNITTRRVAGVLAVPVNALLALAGGGYGVDVVTPGGAVRLTGVSTGLYSATMVQVRGSGLRAGMRVEVPSS